MLSFDNQNLKKLFEKYNAVFAAAYDRLLNEDEKYSQMTADNAEEELRNVVHNTIQNWHSEPLSETTGNLTGDDVLAAVKTLPDALELARYAAAFCDDEFPDIVKIKLSAFGQPLIERLLDAVLTADFAQPTDNVHENNIDLAIVAEYLKLLADWQCDVCLEPVLSKFAAAGEPNEMLADAIRYFLAMFAEQAQPLLLDHLSRALEQNADLDTAGEYLLIALTDIGRELRSDAVFACLRDAFRKMTRKAIGAICLGDYGDGRGVATLRGWMERHSDYDDRQTIAEILSAISRLGGETGDLRHRLKLK